MGFHGMTEKDWSHWAQERIEALLAGKHGVYPAMRLIGWAG